MRSAWFFFLVKYRFKDLIYATLRKAILAKNAGKIREVIVKTPLELLIL